ncbi:tubulin specific chaperone cofactor B [Lineolata rhizophorae]|uniref:Tubulin specific chaperone cofactor B n=1 Tax=Lineolata rhizophorae TaxID=578093 RepID=A0A6A6NSG1_9PEZI|nr:tubulin specific chaperone cofactor B [Lineolata rhizophorae]
MADVPLNVVSANASSERRVSPAWSLARFKARLEPITGVPAAAQKLSLRVASRDPVALEAADEDSTCLAAFPLQPYAEIHVTDTRPAAARVDFSDVSAVAKYTMPEREYEARADSVLAWKKAQKLGRFDPEAPGVEEQRVRALWREVEERGISSGQRCRLLPAETDARRGTVAYVGPVPELPSAAAGGAGEGAPWVGVALDEPVGKNDGRAPGGGRRYFECGGPGRGVFVRPERVEVGDFAPLADLGGEEMEEL